MERVFNCARVVSNYYAEYNYMLESSKTLSTLAWQLLCLRKLCMVGLPAFVERVNKALLR